jgi:hypothetical protein
MPPPDGANPIQLVDRFGIVVVHMPSQGGERLIERTFIVFYDDAELSHRRNESPREEQKS